MEVVVFKDAHNDIVCLNLEQICTIEFDIDDNCDTDYSKVLINLSNDRSVQISTDSNSIPEILRATIEQMLALK